MPATETGTCKGCGRQNKKISKGICTGCRSRIRRHGKKANLLSPFQTRNGPEMPEVSDINIPHRIYDKEWDRFHAWLGLFKERQAKIPPKPQGEYRTEGIISDPHIPFHDLEALTEAVSWLKKQGCSRVWLAGDVCDHYNLSRFSQYEYVPIQHEAVECRKIIDWLAREFAEVKIMAGNHETREKKFLASRLPPDLVQWFMGKGFLPRLTEDIPNVSIVERTVENTPMHWLAPVGDDAVIGHAETYSKIPLRAVENLRAWLDNWHEVLDLHRPRIVFQAHTHQAGVALIGSRMVCELGCSCKLQGYTLEPRIAYRPQRQAVTCFTQVHGRTLFNSVRQYYLNEKN